MKKLGFFLSIMLLMLLTACTTNEDKANKLIKQYMYESLYDYKSYEPTKTTVEVWYPNIFFNEDALEYAQKGIEYAKKVELLKEELEDTQRDMEFAKSLLGNYESSYDRHRYNRAKKEYDEYSTELIDFSKKSIQTMLDIYEIQENIEKSQDDVLGWIGIHKFRCNTRGGYAAVGEYIFLMNADFSEIINVYDAADDEFVECIAYIKVILEEHTKEELVELYQNFE